MIDWVTDTLGLCLEIVLCSDDVKGFVVLPRCWVVERTLACLGRYKRLAKDYEFNPVHSAGMIYAAMTYNLLHRLA